MVSLAAKSIYWSMSVLLEVDPSGISLFLIPTGSADRSVHGLFGFTNRRSDWLTCVWLWRANPHCYVSKINTGNTRRRQRDERRQRDVNKTHFLFRLKKQGIPCFFQRPRTVLCSPTWDVKQSTVEYLGFASRPGSNVATGYSMAIHHW